MSGSAGPGDPRRPSEPVGSPPVMMPTAKGTAPDPDSRRPRPLPQPVGKKPAAPGTAVPLQTPKVAAPQAKANASPKPSSTGASCWPSANPKPSWSTRASTWTPASPKPSCSTTACSRTSNPKGSMASSWTSTRTSASPSRPKSVTNGWTYVVVPNLWASDAVTAPPWTWNSSSSSCCPDTLVASVPADATARPAGPAGRAQRTTRRRQHWQRAPAQRGPGPQGPLVWALSTAGGPGKVAAGDWEGPKRTAEGSTARSPSGLGKGEAAENQRGATGTTCPRQGTRKSVWTKLEAEGSNWRVLRVQEGGGKGQ